MAFAIFLCLQDPALLDRLLEKLHSDDITVRAEAEASIEKVGRACLPRLQEEREREQDAEARARLDSLIDRLGPTVHELWAAGDVDGMLKNLAVKEGAWDVDDHVQARREVLRKFLNPSMDVYDAEKRSLILSLDDACRKLKMDRHWMLAMAVGMLGKDTPPFELSRARRFLAAAGSDSGLAVLPLLKSTDAVARISACCILGNLGDERAVPELERICRDPDEASLILAYAREAYRKIKRRDPPSQEIAPSR